MKLLDKHKEAPAAASGQTARKKSRRSVKKWVALGLAAVLVLAVVLGLRGPAGAPSGSESAQYIQAAVERRDLTTALTDSGSLEPLDSYTVISLVSGEILSAGFETGDVVVKDDVLYRIDSSDTDTSIERAENALRQRQRSYNKVVDSQADLVVKAPISGTLSGFTARTGDTVNKNGMAATLEDTSTLLLTEYYSEEYAGQIYQGMAATVSVTDQMMTLSGRVKEVSSLKRTSQTGVPCFAVTVQVTNPGSLSVGDTATCWLSGGIYPSITDDNGFEANARTTVYYDISGTVDRVPVRNGETVTAGQTLVVLTSDTLADDIQDAADTLRDAELSLQSQYDVLENYTIQAPISGTIVDKYYKEGENAETGKTLCTIFDLSSLTVTLNIDELDIKSVSVGQTAQITADALPGETYEGVITEVGINGTVANGVTTYPVKIQIDEPGELLPGMNVDVSIVVSENIGVLSIPADAVETGSRVLVKTADGATGEGAPTGYQYVKVEIGTSDEDYVQIVSGLEEGDEIAYLPPTAATGFDFMQMRGQMMSQMGGGGGPMGGGPMG